MDWHFRHQVAQDAGFVADLGGVVVVMMCLQPLTHSRVGVLCEMKVFGEVGEGSRLAEHALTQPLAGVAQL